MNNIVVLYLVLYACYLHSVISCITQIAVGNNTRRITFNQLLYSSMLPSRSCETEVCVWLGKTPRCGV